VHVALTLSAQRRLRAEPRSLAHDQRMAITHHLRELTVRLAEIAVLTNLALPLLHLLPLFEALLHLLDIFIALRGERFSAGLALGADRVHVDLALGGLRTIELRTPGELLALGLHPRLRHKLRPLRALFADLLALFVRLLPLFANLLAIFAGLLVVVGLVARPGDRGTRSGARQQQGDEELTHNSDLSKT